MLPLFLWIKRAFGSVRRGVSSTLKHGIAITFKDRAKGVEINRQGNSYLDWIGRSSKDDKFIEIPNVNANTYICTRAISDAIKSLPANIVSTEIIDGVERDVDDNDHEANALLLKPNTEYSFSDLIDHIVKSYLTDGNSILTIEKALGPFSSFEVWPRDPRGVEINKTNRSYKFGAHTQDQVTYPRNRVIHIRDISVDDPFWGTGRLQTVQEEVKMDFFVNRFNSNFFKFGATLNLMFTPDNNLTESQHEEILDALNFETEGAPKAFKTFINRFAGKFEYPDQKHKDIAFLELLKHNREKIFGVFGLPPFRGGVMEFANYANALAQDRDFWLNTIKPILTVIEDAFNQQLLWPLYGNTIKLKFDLSGIPAIKGSQTEIEDRLLNLKDKGIVSAEYVRQELGIDEDAAPKNDDSNETDSTDKDDVENKSRLKDVLFKIYKSQRSEVLDKIKTATCSGYAMSVLCDPESQSKKFYNMITTNKEIRNNVQPLFKELLFEKGIIKTAGKKVFDVDDKIIEQLQLRTTLKIEDVVDQNTVLLKIALADADKNKLTYIQLEKRIRKIFSYERAQHAANVLTADFLSNVDVLVFSTETNSSNLTNIY